MHPLSRALIALAACLTAHMAIAHEHGRPRDDNRPIAEFPDVGELKVLSVDLHTHSVFSDGHVWPSIRAEEAARDVIDGVAITEHLEWQPHISDIPHPDRNRSFEEAKRFARNLDVLVIPGVEITRVGDPGHINAVFIKDANPLVQASGIKDYNPDHLFDTEAEALAAAREQSQAFAGAHKVQRGDDERWAPFENRSMYMTLVNFGVAASREAEEVLRAAAAQGAFTFWNHPSFATANAKATRFHTRAIKDGVLHGVEIANGNNYYPNAHRLAIKHNLALIGTSDVHQLIAWDYNREKNQHRPVTLVLAKERSQEAIKQALFDRRTLVWWNHTMIGRQKEIDGLLAASISVEGTEPGFEGRTRVLLRNHSGADWQVTHTGKQPTTTELAPFLVKAKSVTEVMVRNDDQPGELKLKVLNALSGPGDAAEITLPFNQPTRK